jgi:5'-nucleotidase
MLGMSDIKPIGLIDMDGTVADMASVYSKALASLRSPAEPSDTHFLPTTRGEPAYLKARKDLIKSQPGFWRNLPRLELGFDVVQAMKELDYSLHVLSKAPLGIDSAWSEKAGWCREHLPGIPVTVLDEGKHLVYGRVLVDDWPAYFMPWLAVRPRGLVVAVAHPWNDSVVHSRVIRYDGTNLAQVVEALEKAKARDRVVEG